MFALRRQTAEEMRLSSRKNFTGKQAVGNFIIGKICEKK